MSKLGTYIPICLLCASWLMESNYTSGSGRFIVPCIQSRRRKDAADPAGGWFVAQTNQTPSAPGVLHLHSSAPTGNTPAEFCCTRQTESWTGARAGEDKHTKLSGSPDQQGQKKKWLFEKKKKKSFAKEQRATYRQRGGSIDSEKGSNMERMQMLLEWLFGMTGKAREILLSSSLPHTDWSVTCQNVQPRGTAWPLPLSLTTVGSAKGLALACGNGEPAIAMATDWLIVFPLSGSASSAWAEAWRTRTGEESAKK